MGVKMTIWLKCNECGEEQEIKIWDGPLFCPLCRCVDCFSELEE